MTRMAFLLVDRAGHISPPLSASQMMTQSAGHFGFWRCWIKAKLEQHCPAGESPQDSQGGGTLLSPPPPAALAIDTANPVSPMASGSLDGGQPGQSTPAAQATETPKETGDCGTTRAVTEPEAETARVAAPEPVVNSDPAGSGAKLSKAEKAAREAAVVADYLAGDSLAAIRSHHGLWSDGAVYYILHKAGVALRNKKRPVEIEVDLASGPDISVETTICDGEIIAVKEVHDEADAQIDGKSSQNNCTDRAGIVDAPATQRDRIDDGKIGQLHRSAGPGNGGALHSNGDAQAPEVAPKKPPIRDWITQRKEEMAAASAYLKTHGIVVSVSNPHAEIKMFRLSDRGGTHYHESVLDAARALGWEGLV